MDEAHIGRALTLSLFLRLFEALFHILFQPQHGWGLIIAVIGCVVFCFILFVFLQQLPSRARKWLIILCTFLAGLIYAVEFFWPPHPDPRHPGILVNFMDPYMGTVNDIATVIGSFTLGLGIYSLSLFHGRKLLRRRSGWFYSLTFFVSMITIAVLGLVAYYRSNVINVDIYHILFNGGLISLDSTMFALVAFYITSAAYRAFRIRNTEASLLMVSAFIVMLGQVAVGPLLTNWLPKTGLPADFRIEVLSDWLLTRVNAPAVRAIGFGLGVGLLATTLRIWLSLERGSYFEQEL